MRFGFSHLSRLAESLLDAVLPPLCLSCGGVVEKQGFMCHGCWARLNFIERPFCACCGFMFDIPVETGAVCGACAEQAPPFTTARAALVYDDGSRPLVLGFKHGDHTHGALPLARWMVRAGEEMLKDADFIVPVPLHRWRLLKRRYNQAALLCHALGQLTQRPVLVDALVRQRVTASQGHLSAKERAENVHGAFVVRGAMARKIKGRRLVLVDDVMTTGATVKECAKILNAAGALRVDVLTLARTKGRASC